MNEAPEMISIEMIAANPYQVREVEDPVAVAELAANIEKNGLLQPPTVRRLQIDESESGHDVSRPYQIAFGHTRLAAFRLLNEQGKPGFGQIPCFVKDLDDLQMFEMAVAENIKRRDLNPIERARAMQTYMDRFQKTSAETGEFFGVEESTVRGAVRLLDLPEPAQEMVASGELTVGNARKVLTISRVAPSEVPGLLKDLKDSPDPETTIAEVLQESEGVVFMDRSYSGSEKELTAGDGLWPLAMAEKNFTRLPKLTAAEAAKSLGWEFTSTTRMNLEGFLPALESPLVDATAQKLISDGMDPDKVEHLVHLLHPPACTACPLMARSGDRYFCGLKLCHERKKKSWLVTSVEKKSEKLGIAIYDPKVDGKDLIELSNYQEKHKKLFEGRDENLRLRAAPRSYTLPFTDSSTVQVILVGKQAEKVKEAERKERESYSSRSSTEDYEKQQAIRQANEKKVYAFLWNQAVPEFLPMFPVECLPLLEAIDGELYCRVAPDDAEPAENAKSKTKVEFFRRNIVAWILDSEVESYTDSTTAVTDTAKKLQDVAKAWGVKLPKDWLKKAEAEDAVSTESE